MTKKAEKIVQTNDVLVNLSPETVRKRIFSVGNDRPPHLARDTLTMSVENTFRKKMDSASGQQKRVIARISFLRSETFICPFQDEYFSLLLHHPHLLRISASASD